MIHGDSAFVADIPWQVVVLSQMRPYEWAENLMRELTPEERLRELEARYTGADENPVIRDETLTESRTLTVMENRHCGRDDVVYIIGYDVSYEDGAKNAKCAAVVLKCERQKEYLKRNRFLKSVVYVDDWPPPPNSMIQAKKIKDLWYRFCKEGGDATYLAIDGWQYGKAVIEDIMKELNDGLPPLCIRRHAAYTEAELPGALPVIYPIKAGGVGVTDQDSEMLRYAELQFEERNVRLLAANINEGVEAYKKFHLIKDDYSDYSIAIPYQKTRELVGQIQNLKKVPSGASMKEVRISKHTQRYSWSACKYALRLAQIIEREEYQSLTQKPSDWEEELARFRNGDRFIDVYSGARGSRRMRGRRFR